MAWTPPSYLPNHIQSLTISYEWDDLQSDKAHNPIDEELRARLARLPLRAILAYTIAVAEWMVYRFLPLLDNSLPSDYLEAAWAQVVNWRYAADWEVWAEEDEWAGPVKCPIYEALIRIQIIIVQATEEDGDFAWRAAHITKLVEYVLPSNDEFMVWCEQIVTRLASHFEGHRMELGGDVVPKEFFDVRSTFDSTATEPLINRYLRGLDREANPFLKSPDEMKESGFPGTPYVFVLKEDLKTGWQR